MRYLSLIGSILAAEIASRFNPYTRQKRSWWLKIETRSPPVVYYFGPYNSWREALSERGGFIEDLRGEGALGFEEALSLANPERLTLELGETTVNRVESAPWRRKLKNWRLKRERTLHASRRV